MATDKNLQNLVLNKVENQEVFNYMQANNLVNEDELYLIAGDTTVGNAPAYTYGMEDLTAGTSELATGTLHFVYE